ncbi:unnamed protein product [Euphydryas editha]|uniref:Gag-like protein n=1 Tax=Euphydryas editha TaxID=104508 RepID=A0AAU9VEX6_EUPED|nr:unnamed protein product [Euphydryas editha]
MGKIRDIVRARECGIKVERIRKAKDQKVVMGFITTEERDKAKKKLAGERTGLAVEVLKNRDPLVVLKGVSKDISDEEVVRALRNQNGELFGGLDLEDDRLSIKYRKQTRSQYTTQVVLSTSPALWKRITEAGKANIDLRRVVVLDQTPLVQCTRCLGYGHSKKYCKDRPDLCSHCGGTHTREKCTDWLAAIPPLYQLRKSDDLARSTTAYQ